jgi:hypothetical protein
LKKELKMIIILYKKYGCPFIIAKSKKERKCDGKFGK